MILKIFIAFLLIDCVLAFLLWLLISDDLLAAEQQIAQAEKERDRAIDDWFRAPDLS